MEKQKRLKKSRYITGFDGIRSLAVMGVILYHLLPRVMTGGYLGVPIFFVVSGYLITDLLRQEWEQNGKINIWQFYVRRMKRLYPGLVFLLVTASAYITLFQRGLLNNLRGTVISSLFYVNNWWQINNGLSYFDRFANESPFTHIWSLAVEGQNYLFWPIIFVLLMTLVRMDFLQRIGNVGNFSYPDDDFVFTWRRSNSCLLWNRYTTIFDLARLCVGFCLAKHTIEKRDT